MYPNHVKVIVMLLSLIKVTKYPLILILQYMSLLKGDLVPIGIHNFADLALHLLGDFSMTNIYGQNCHSYKILPWFRETYDVILNKSVSWLFCKSWFGANFLGAKFASVLFKLLFVSLPGIWVKLPKKSPQSKAKVPELFCSV